MADACLSTETGLADFVAKDEFVEVAAEPAAEAAVEAPEAKKED